MICYKKYPCALNSQEIYQYLSTTNKILDNEFFYNNLDHREFFQHFPKIKLFLQSHKVSCVGIGLIKIFHNKVSIHQDNSAANGGTVRVNWPVTNCEYSETIFYENFNGVKETRYLDNGTVWHEYQDADCREIDRFTLDSVSALDVSVPHRVLCQRFPRIALTFHLRPNPTWLLR